MDEVRELLYYFGFLAPIAFSLRFLIQWIFSEIKKESVVPASFWWLSIVGNFSLMTHSAIQLQYPICVIQAINAVISVRNLNLLQKSSLHWRFFPTVLLMACLAFILPTIGFYLWSADEWLRIPTHFFSSKPLSISLFWHFFGILGVFLYASRFWLQWLEAEIAQKSTLEESFWWLSIIGALFSFIYFLKIQDLVNLIGPLFGIIPYFRNLMLLKKKRKVLHEQT